MVPNAGNESDLSELLSERFGSEESATSIFYVTIKYVLCWCSYSVQKHETCQDDCTYCMQQVRALRIGVRTFGLRGIGSEKDLVYLEDPCNFLRNSAAPPAPEPAEGRGAAYNNNFFLTLARGLVLYATESTHLFAWFYILYSRQAGISQTCCAVTLLSVWPARHAMVISNLFCLQAARHLLFASTQRRLASNIFCV